MAKNTLLFLIIFLAFVLRFWQLGVIPPGLFGDEVDTGYQAYSILKTGKDYFGNRFPVHFQSFGDWRVPLYIYLDTLFVAIFGLREIAVRLPAAFLGIFGVLVTYFLAKKITKNEKVSLFSSLLLAISPWHVQFSRVGVEAIFLTILFSLGLIFFLKGIEKNAKIKWIFWAGIFLGLTVYSYNTPKLFLPLIILVLIGIWAKLLFNQKKKLAVFFMTLAIVLIPLGLDFLKGSTQARFLGISIFSDLEVAEKVRIAREKCNYEGVAKRILHNKVTVWADTFTKNYLSSYSLDFLFAKGDPNPRHSIGGRGELYLFELPFLLLGIGIVFLKAFKEKEKIFQLIFWWLILTPIPASLTLNGGTHAIRLFHFLPWFQIVTAIGFIHFVDYLKSEKLKSLFLFGFSLVFIISLFDYVHNYFLHYPKISGRWWNYGYREIFEFVNKVEGKYEKIYVSPSWEPSLVYTLFYSQYPPGECQKQISISPLNIGKFYFHSPDLGRLKRGEGEKGTLYILNPAELEIVGLKPKDTPGVKFIKDIKAPDGAKSFIILSSVDVF